MAERARNAKLEADGSWEWCVVLASFLVNLLSDGFMYTSGLMIRAVREYFAASRRTMGALAAVTSTIAYGSAFITGALVTRWGCRRVGLAGAALFGLGLMLSSFASSMQYLFFSSAFVAGWGVGLCYIPSLVIVAQHFTYRRSLATGIAVSGSGVGTFLFAPIVGFLLEKYGWRGSYAILGAIGWNCAACAILYRPVRSMTSRGDGENTRVGDTCQDVERDIQVHHTEPSTRNPAVKCLLFWKERRSLLKNKAFVLFCGSVFVFSFGENVFFPFLPDLAMQEGFSTTNVSLLISLAGIGSTVSRIVFGWVSDRSFINKQATYGSIKLVMGVSVILCPIVAKHYEALACNVVLYGACFGCLVAQHSVVLSELVGTVIMANALGISLSLGSLASLLGAPLSGLMFDHSGSYSLPFTIMGGLMVIGGVLNLFVLCTPEGQDARKRQLTTTESCTETRGRSFIVEGTEDVPLDRL